MGNVIENDLFYAPKSRLGLAVLLRGTGMVLHREILEQHPWSALSNTEDIEYSLSLIERGIATRFLPGVSVWSDFPENAEQLQVQRRRWASGSAGRVGVRSFRLIGQGLRRGEAGTIDAGWTLAVLSRPMVIVSVLLGLIAAGAGLWWGKEPRFLPVFLAACANALALVAYFGWGILRLGVTRRRMIMLLSAPWVVCQLVVATVLGSLGVDRSVWRQTPRAGPVKVSGLEEGVHQGKGESA